MESNINKLLDGTNIVIVNDFDYTQGGASKVAIDTANLLANTFDNINVYFFSAVHSETTNLSKKVKCICTNQGEAMKDKNKLRGCINGIYNFKVKKEFKKLLVTLDRNNTIIHVHGWTKALSSSVFSIAFKMKFKVVLTMHDYFTACPNGGYFNYKCNKICKLKPLSWKCVKCNCDSRNYGFKVYRIIRQFVQNKIVKLNNKLTNVISISDFSENILKATLNTNTKIHRVYNPIEFNKINKKMDFTKNNYYLYVGRVTKEKGVDIFCEVISSLKLKGIVVGTGEQKEKLEKKYPSVTFVGWKNTQEVNEYMKNAKALIMPSRWYEGMPLTNLEALSNGIPSIVSNCCAASEISNLKNSSGLVFDINDINDLKNKINEIEFLKIDFSVLNLFSTNNYLINVCKVYMNDVKNN